MEITRETDYAVRCVLYLAERRDSVIMIDEISGAMQIPRSFLAKILQKLSKADIVTAFRGVKGGFQLSRNPTMISLLDVVQAVEGPVALNRCVHKDGYCVFKKTCSVHPVWKELSSTVEEHLASVAVSSLIDNKLKTATKSGIKKTDIPCV